MKETRVNVKPYISIGLIGLLITIIILVAINVTNNKADTTKPSGATAIPEATVKALMVLKEEDAKELKSLSIEKTQSEILFSNAELNKAAKTAKYNEQVQKLGRVYQFDPEKISFREETDGKISVIPFNGAK